MKLYTTIEELKKYGACYDEEDWAHLKRKLNIKAEDQLINITDALPVAGIEGCVWALRTQRYKNICLFLADVAEMVLPIWTQEYPSDRCVQRCISLIRKYAVGLTSERELLEAVSATTTVAYTVDATTDTAGAAINAAYATAYAAYTTDVITYSFYTAYAAYTAEKKKTWQQIEQLFIKHFGE